MRATYVSLTNTLRNTVLTTRTKIVSFDYTLSLEVAVPGRTSLQPSTGPDIPKSHPTVPIQVHATEAFINSYKTGKLDFQKSLSVCVDTEFVFICAFHFLPPCFDGCCTNNTHIFPQRDWLFTRSPHSYFLLSHQLPGSSALSVLSFHVETISLCSPLLFTHICCLFLF